MLSITTFCLHFVYILLIFHQHARHKILRYRFFAVLLQKIQCTMELQITSLDTIHETAKQFIQLIDQRKVFAFNGSMGAGKTTFIKALCEELKVIDIVNSPTFAIVNEYETEDHSIIYHFDCYRLNNLREAYDLGAEEYLYSGNLCFIEWPENIEPLLPENTRYVHITENNDGTRTLRIDD